MKKFLSPFNKLNCGNVKIFGQNLGQKLKNQVTNITSKSSNTTKNALVASLISLASITAGGILYTGCNDTKEKQSYTYINDSTELDTELDKELERIPDPQMLAKVNGADSTLVEPNELDILLDYSPLEGLPLKTVTQIRETIYSNFKNVDANSSNAKQEINNQIKNAQSFINGVAIDSYFSIRQFYTKNELKHLYKHISGSEILNRIDFTELQKYQEDLSMTKFLIRNSLSNIERNDPKCEEKMQEQVEHSQKFVNRIVDGYKLRGKVIGNIDYNENLTKKEFMNLLDLSPLYGMKKNLAYKIIIEAVGDYKPYTLYDNSTENDVNKLNEKILSKLSEAQQYINDKAAELNTNIIKYDPEHKNTIIIDSSNL